MRSVAKHSYIKGRNARGRAKAHVNYIQYRAGEDREKERGGARPFFDSDRDTKTGAEVKREIHEQGKFGLTHKLILSPGMQGVDLKEYTREVLGQLGRDKGLDLKWSAVEHRNTDHDHVHVVLMGKDEHGRKVHLDREDYKKIRELGDRYLERNHQLDRFLDREMKDLLREGAAYNREGDREFQDLLGDILRDREHREDREKPEKDKPKEREDEREEDEKRKEREKTGQTEREFKKFDKDLARSLRNTEIHRTLSGKQWTREMQGRLQEYHASYQMGQAKEYWAGIMKEDPTRAEEAEKQLEYLHGLEQENRQDNMDKWRELDGLLGERHGRDFVEKTQDRTQQQTQERQTEQQQQTQEQAREQSTEHARIENLGTIERTDESSREDKQERSHDDEERGRGDRGDR